MVHYAISALRNIKKFSLNSIINCCLQVLCISTLIIIMLHLFSGSIAAHYQALMLIFIFIIMLIAGFSFYTLSSILLLKRKNEFSLRLMLGARLNDISVLIMVESLLRLIVATVISLVVADLIIPLLNVFTINKLNLEQDFNWKIIPVLLLLYLFTVAVAWLNLNINKKKLSAGFD